MPHPDETYRQVLDQIRLLDRPGQHYQFRRLARTDLYFLLRYVLGRLDVAHPWIWDRCREVQADPNGHLDLWARAHYKSTLITYGKTIQDILASHGEEPLAEWQGREPTFGIFSHTRPIAKGFLRQIKRELESNPFLINLFPDILWDNPNKEAPKWGEDDGIIVKRRSNPKESTVEAWGLVDGQPTSRHYAVMVYDDVVTLESVSNAEMINKTTDRWEISTNLATEDGVQRYIGTRYHDDDTYRVLIDRGVAVPRVYPATIDGTASGTPVLLSQEAVTKRRRDMTPYNFACQLLLDPIPADTAYFRSDWVQYYDRIPEYVTYWAASDYAVTDGGGDYTVHGVIAVDPDENIYLVDWWREQTDAAVWVETCIDMGKRYKPILWAEESGQINKGVGPFLAKRMRERSAFFAREQFVPSTNKATRAQSIRGRWAMGKVFLPRDAAWVSDLVAEMIRFPVGRNDDQVDVMALFGLMLDKFYGLLVPEPEEQYQGSGRELLDVIGAMGQHKGARYG